MIKKIVLIFAGLILLSACSANTSSTKKTEITVSAAASMQTSLTEVTKAYEKSNPNVTVNLNFAASGTIRQEVTSGAPIDGVVLASQSDIQQLGNKVVNSQVILGNQLLLITNKKSSFANSKTSWTADLTAASKIAIGAPSTVPAGKYAQETLQKLGIYDSLQTKFVQGSDVTQVLSYVAAGNADLGFVYKTDALTNKNVTTVAAIPDNLHDKISYYTAKVAASKNSQQISNFNKYLLSSTAQASFKKYGFITK